jgi:adenylate cyclase
MVRTFKGIKPSALNPHYCNDCELVTDHHPGGAEADVALLFADIRGSTALAETMEPADYSAVISRFFSEASQVLIHAGALIDNLAGDGVNAIFARGFAGEHYVRKAIDAGRRLLEVTGHGPDKEPWVPIGVGVHWGRAFVGGVGDAGHLVTISAFGDSVNVAARLSSVAGKGEAVISEAACRQAEFDCHDYPSRHLQLKGRAEPVTAHVISA